MIEQKDLGGNFTLPGKSLTLNRVGYGASNWRARASGDRRRM